MGRRAKGRPISGWLVVDKPAGVTSTQVVGKARWALEARKAGHAGTLDPLATGVLAIAFGEATKTIPFVTDALKAYRFTVRWGEERDTDDAEGEVAETSAARPSREAILSALPAFRGDIMQTPPRFSAVKVAGERAYDLAREGREAALAARPLHVESLDLLAMPDADRAEFEMVCGKGGYVRAIARDLGRALGCLGHVTALRRIWAGPFEEADAVSLDQVEAMRGDAEAPARLLPVEAGLTDLPQVRVPPAAVPALRQGREAPVSWAPDDLDYGDEAWASSEGRAVAIGRWRGGLFRPTRVFAGD